MPVILYNVVGVGFGLGLAVGVGPTIIVVPPPPPPPLGEPKVDFAINAAKFLTSASC